MHISGSQQTSWLGGRIWFRVGPALMRSLPPDPLTLSSHTTRILHPTIPHFLPHTHLAMSVSADERARRLAAIEARLNPPTEPSPAASAEGDGSASAPRSGSGSGNATPRTPPRGLPKPWTPPSDHARRERRRELARILNRTIVRDSGYAQAAACIEVSGDGMGRAGEAVFVW